MEFWLHELQEPAMAYAHSQANLEPSWAHQQRDQDRKGKGKWQTGKGGHPRTKAGRFDKSRWQGTFLQVQRGHVQQRRMPARAPMYQALGSTSSGQMRFVEQERKRKEGKVLKQRGHINVSELRQTRTLCSRLLASRWRRITANHPVAHWSRKGQERKRHGADQRNRCHGFYSHFSSSVDNGVFS